MNIRESAEAVIVEPEQPADSAVRCTVIWLHGVGADGYDFLPIVPELKLAAAAGARFVFPHAPLRAITMSGGARMRAWCDFRNLTRSDQQDEAGIRDSTRLIDGFVRAQLESGIAADRIVLGGFSQGGAMALHAGLRYPQRLAGLVALSSYLPLHMNLAAERHPANADVPILMCHGRFDAVLPMTMGSMARDYLRLLGHPVQWRDDPVGHGVCDGEIALLGSWLAQRLA